MCVLLPSVVPKVLKNGIILSLRFVLLSRTHATLQWLHSTTKVQPSASFVLYAYIYCHMTQWRIIANDLRGQTVYRGTQNNTKLKIVCCLWCANHLRSLLDSVGTHFRELVTVAISIRALGISSLDSFALAVPPPPWKSSFLHFAEVSITEGWLEGPGNLWRRSKPGPFIVLLLLWCLCTFLCIIDLFLGFIYFLFFYFLTFISLIWLHMWRMCSVCGIGEQRGYILVWWSFLIVLPCQNAIHIFKMKRRNEWGESTRAIGTVEKEPLYYSINNCFCKDE